MITGSYKKAVKLAHEAIKHYALLNDEKGIAHAKYNIAGVYYKTNNYHSGLIYLMDCLSVYNKHRDFHGQASLKNRLAPSMNTLVILRAPNVPTNNV